MYLPMGDHGVVSVGAQQGHEFTESDVSVGKILASNAVAAFDRVERERSCCGTNQCVDNVRDMMYVLDDEGRFQLVTEPLAAGSVRAGDASDPYTRSVSNRTRLMSLRRIDRRDGRTGAVLPSNRYLAIRHREQRRGGDEIR